MGAPGGWNEMDTSDPAVIDLAKWGMDEINKKAPDQQAMDFISIDSAESQVVAGVKYYITYKAKNVASEIYKKVEITIWEKPWENFKQIISETISDY
jgi:hypothetical protein